MIKMLVIMVNSGDEADDDNDEDDDYNLRCLCSQLKDQIIASSLRDIIPKYRDDPDLQNLIDWVQSDWVRNFSYSFFLSY